MSQKLNIALVGCGRISKKHFNAIYESRKNLNLVAVCDTNINVKESVPVDLTFNKSSQSLYGFT